MRRLTLGLALMLGLGAAAGLGAEAATQVVVQAVHGQAVYIPLGRQVGAPVKVGMLLGRGNTIKTGANGSLRLLLPEGSSIGIAPNTSMTLGSLIPRRGHRATMKLLEGMMRWVVAKATGQRQDLDYEVYVGNAVAAVKGTDLLVRAGHDGMEVTVFNSEHQGVEVGDARGRHSSLVVPGHTVLRGVDGGMQDRALGRDDYLAAGRAWPDLERPWLPKGVPDHGGAWGLATPLASPKGPEGRKAALDLLKGSALGQQKPQLAVKLADAVADGKLGLRGLQRLLSQEEENQLNLAKAAALAGAVQALEKDRDWAASLVEQSFGRDDLAGQALGDDGVPGDQLQQAGDATAAAAADPAAVAAAAAQMQLDAGKLQSLAQLWAAQAQSQGSGLEGGLLGLDAATAAGLKAGLLVQVADAAAQALALVGQAPAGAAGDAARQKAADALGVVDQGLGDELAKQTGLGAGDLQGNMPPSIDAGASARELVEDLRQDLGVSKGQDQKLRAKDLYSGASFIDRQGYQVQVASRILRPDAYTVVEQVTSVRTDGPDAGASRIRNSYSYNLALPQDWTGIVGRDLNAPDNLVGGSPTYYLTLRELSVQSPAGCTACLSAQYDAPQQLVSGLWAQGRTETYQVMGVSVQRALAPDGTVTADPDGLTIAPPAVTADGALTVVYSYVSGGATLELFTAKIWLIDGAGTTLSSAPLGLPDSLGGLNVLSDGDIAELAVSSPYFNLGSGHVDVLMTEPDLAKAFQW